MRMNLTGNVFALYDELMELYKRLGHQEFMQEAAKRCEEFRKEHPDSSSTLVRMLRHIEAKRSGKTA